jgi:hypothetical protein
MVFHGLLNPIDRMNVFNSLCQLSSLGMTLRFLFLMMTFSYL